MVMLTAFCLQLSARTFSQTITFQGKNIPLEKIFGVIEKQTGYLVFYDYRQISHSRPVTVNAKNESLRDFLDWCFKEQPFGYAIEDKTIIIAKPAAPPPASTNKYA